MAQVDRGHRNGGGAHYSDWRRDVLVRSGFDDAVAAAVAAEPRFDVHKILELVDRGCPPHLAVRILAPLDGEEGESW